MNFSPTKMLSVMKMTAMLLLAAALQVSAATSAQQVNLNVRKMPLDKVFTALGKQTGYAFFWDQQLLSTMQPITLELHNVSLREALTACLAGKPLIYELVDADKSVFIRKSVAEPVTATTQQVTVRGHVTGDEKTPLAGVTISVKGTPRGAITDEKGDFTLLIADPKSILVCSMLGYETQEHPVAGKSFFNISLQRKTQRIGEVMVTTGIFTRRKESFTGDAATYTGEQLNTVGNQNILQSLKSLDPAFIVIDNNMAGSNPNTMPNMVIQGKSSIIGTVDKFSKDPNQPLFILDGFETSIETVIALDMNRIAAVTVLKDAASTAIYGSKAANGVIVIETKLPRPGKMNLSLTVDNTTSFADLRDYNMMNAAEKLEFERLTNLYTVNMDNTSKYNKLQQQYNKHLTDVLSGVDTYWMGYPIRKTSLANTYAVQADGGDTKFRYGIGAKYRDQPGVMKGSQRNTASANVDLVYRPGKFSFSNRILLNTFTAKESEYGSFADYVNTIPYYKPTMDKYLEVRQDLYTDGNVYVWNPLYQARLPKKDQTQDIEFTNQLQSYYMITDQFRIEAKFAMTYGTNEREVYHSPEMEEFSEKEVAQRGSYNNTRMRRFNYQGFLQASYGKIWNNEHELNIVPGFYFDGGKNIMNSYMMTGFPAITQISPAFGSGYPEGGTPGYTSAVNRSVSGFVNAYYGWRRKYMMDFDYRKDGSSIFGASRRYTDTWTVGVSWNLHNESFLKPVKWINYLKLRGSIGNPGNQNFASYNSFTTLMYNQGIVNSFGLGTKVDSWGNTNLAWQKTLKKTIGLDMRLLKERISFVANVYNNFTDPLIVNIGNAPSTGSDNVMFNVGNSRTKGFDFTVSGAVIDIPKDRISLRINVMGKRESTTYGGLGNALDLLNRQNQNAVSHDKSGSFQDYENISQNLQRYKDGGHPDDLWAVRSMGIDPATGREVFLTKDGELTYNYDVANIVKVGNSMPLMQGAIGLSGQYKGLSVNVVMRYMWQSQQFNNALFGKVENLTRQQVYYGNLDKRALYARWKQPGDQAQFVGIPNLTYMEGAAAGWNSSYMSSRFIQTENTLSGESLSASYNFYQSKWLKVLKLQGLNITGYMNDIFRLSNIERERGIDYPFARSFSFKVNATF
ncbi:SusC/RagA family TonB-linked outer membrane protein [Chitinophaga sp.]|uniref:SusC/RagA family TonB-linked outer membrane protein n=1 Tax=Chitinophaga sp. TaxID=1869181 RepID=UPI002F93073E